MYLPCSKLYDRQVDHSLHNTAHVTNHRQAHIRYDIGDGPMTVIIVCQRFQRSYDGVQTRHTSLMC